MIIRKASKTVLLNDQNTTDQRRVIAHDRPKPRLTFGRDGKPMYISGPHDDGEKIIRKLHRGLGDANYDFVHVLPD